MSHWFRRVGQHENSVLASWEDWPGPEAPECEAIAALSQASFERIAELYAVSYAIFVAQVKEVLAAVAKVHEWDGEEDCYDPRTAAAWEAAWWFVIKEYALEYGMPLSEKEARIIAAFEEGYWPYGMTDSGALLIF